MEYPDFGMERIRSGEGHDYRATFSRSVLFLTTPSLPPEAALILPPRGFLVFRNTGDPELNSDAFPP